MMWNLAGPDIKNLSWLQTNHPEWILYECDRKTVKMWDRTDPQIDTSQPEVVAWQLAQMAGPDSPLIKAGYNAISVDNFLVDVSGFGACGHFAKNGSWIQQCVGCCAKHKGPFS
jgi:hypothetical protein